MQEYVQNFIEREVRLMHNVDDLQKFRLFLQHCAAETGKPLNLTTLGKQTGISDRAAKTWLSVLQRCFMVLLLPPYHQHFGKRTVKAPKLFFFDTGVACHLLGITTVEQLNTHPLKESLFENMVIADMVKETLHKGIIPMFYYWRDSTGNEVKCLVEEDEKVTAIEINSASILKTDFLKNLNYYHKISGANPEDSMLFYSGNKNQMHKSIRVVSWRNIK
jgi:predicted AAA+ superfamily ATPase